MKRNLVKIATMALVSTVLMGSTSVLAALGDTVHDAPKSEFVIMPEVTPEMKAEFQERRLNSNWGIAEANLIDKNIDYSNALPLEKLGDVESFYARTPEEILESLAADRTTGSINWYALPNQSVNTLGESKDDNEQLAYLTINYMVGEVFYVTVRSSVNGSAVTSTYYGTGPGRYGMPYNTYAAAGTSYYLTLENPSSVDMSLQGYWTP